MYYIELYFCQSTICKISLSITDFFFINSQPNLARLSYGKLI